MRRNASALSNLTIKENLEFVARIYGLPSPSQADDIAGLGLGGRENQLAGIYQVMEAASALYLNPQLLLWMNRQRP
jgi:ABC-2 type transport system ATP-binding protein